VGTGGRERELQGIPKTPIYLSQYAGPLVVRVTDRGPFVAGRIIDLSAEAARQFGFKEKGLACVRLQVVKPS
jgi:rare lipoprotein A